MLLDGLLGVLPLSGLLESLGRDGSLQALELEGVSGGEEVGVVDSLLGNPEDESASCMRMHGALGLDVETDLDERLDLRSPSNSLSTHRLGDLQGVPASRTTVSSSVHFVHLSLCGAHEISPGKSSDSLLDSGNNGVRVRPVLGTLVDLLDDDDLLSSLSSREDDGDLAGLVDCAWVGKEKVVSRCGR